MNNGVYTADFVGRVCEKCQVSFRQGYVSKVVHPKEGVWDISDELTVWLENESGERESILIDPAIREAAAKREADAKFKDIDKMLSEVPSKKDLEWAKNLQPVKTETRTVLMSPSEIYDGVVAGIDYFPALNLFLIVATLLLILWATPSVIQRWKEKR